MRGNWRSSIPQSGTCSMTSQIFTTSLTGSLTWVHWCMFHISYNSSYQITVRLELETSLYLSGPLFLLIAGLITQSMRICLMIESGSSSESSIISRSWLWGRLPVIVSGCKVWWFPSECFMRDVFHGFKVNVHCSANQISSLNWLGLLHLRERERESQESATLEKIGMGLPERNALMSTRACLGLWRATSWPAPLTVTKVKPLYTWVHPPTCISTSKHILSTHAQCTYLNSRCHPSYLAIIIPGMPWCDSLKLHGIDVVPGWCHWNHRISIPTAATLSKYLHDGEYIMGWMYHCIAWSEISPEHPDAKPMMHELMIDIMNRSWGVLPVLADQITMRNKRKKPDKQMRIKSLSPSEDILSLSFSLSLFSQPASLPLGPHCCRVDMEGTLNLWQIEIHSGVLLGAGVILLTHSTH